ncbi:MAG: hypothetical protein R3B09_06170 [Nannocystaceae bacterium]
MASGLRTTLASLLLLGPAACSSSAAEGPPAAKEGAKEAAAKEAAAKEAAAKEAAAPAPAEPGLSADQLKGVLDGAKIDVRRTCAPLARLRERVDVDLTIAGSSGAVANTNVAVNGGNPELASCVAGELARLSFPKAAKVTRTTVSITF